MNCLLCGNKIRVDLLAKDIFLLRPSDSRLCFTCKSQFELIPNQHCSRCYKLGEENICSDCQLWEEKGWLPSHQALYSYNEAMKSYFSTYKFMGDYSLRYAFAKEIKEALKSYKDYTIVPVPLGQARFAERRFNQVTGLLEAAGVTYENLLLKKDIDKQSSRTREERLAVACPFYIEDNNIELPKRILIVDDIYTTGATLRGIYQLFSEKDVKDLKSFSLSR